MSTLFRLDASIRLDGSRSRALADIVQDRWSALNPDGSVVTRDIGLEPLDPRAWGEAVSAAHSPADTLTTSQQDARRLAATLVDELESADALLLAVPLYNFGVSQHFKTWVDLVITDPRMASGVTPAVKGKPAVLATVRGGAYGAGTPREGWDHATAWMCRILADVWELELDVVEQEFTLVGTNPALDQFTDLAETMRSEAERLASSHGENLGRVRQLA